MANLRIKFNYCVVVTCLLLTLAQAEVQQTQNADKGAALLPTSPNNATLNNVVAAKPNNDTNKTPPKCVCDDGILLPRLGDNNKELEICPECKCKVEARNTTLIKDDSTSVPPLPNTSNQELSARANVLNRVGHQQDKWKRQVREQRRHIYDRHTMLN